MTRPVPSPTASPTSSPRREETETEKRPTRERGGSARTRSLTLSSRDDWRLAAPTLRQVSRASPEAGPLAARRRRAPTRFVRPWLLSPSRCAKSSSPTLTQVICYLYSISRAFLISSPREPVTPQIRQPHTTSCRPLPDPALAPQNPATSRAGERRCVAAAMAAAENKLDVPRL